MSSDMCSNLLPKKITCQYSFNSFFDTVDGSLSIIDEEDVSQLRILASSELDSILCAIVLQSEDSSIKRSECSCNTCRYNLIASTPSSFTIPCSIITSLFFGLK